jgi:hypothetical protein
MKLMCSAGWAEGKIKEVCEGRMRTVQTGNCVALLRGEGESMGGLSNVPAHPLADCDGDGGYAARWGRGQQGREEKREKSFFVASLSLYVRPTFTQE